MTISRNWLKTLWRTSYKGASFWVETDQASGGRRLVVHEFPMRDVPYVEDLGERYHEFTVTAYVASDRADTEAASLMSMCATRGPGILVLPTIGPVVVRCAEFSRTHVRDRLGYIAHSLKFIREGALGALISSASLINMIFVQSEATASAAVSAYTRVAMIKDVPDYVQKSLQTGTENALATLEAVRTSVNVEPVANAEQRNAIESAYTKLPEVMASEDTDELAVVAGTITSVALSLVENMEPSSGLASMVSVIEATPIATEPAASETSVWRFSVAVNTQAANNLLRIAALTAYCEAVARVKVGDRRAAITLRANVSSYFEEQLGALSSDEYEIYNALIKLRDATVNYLSRAIIDLAPVVRVAASYQMPSLFWAWRLYKDPTRSSELVDRNRVAHPSFMPAEFEALGK